MADTSLTLSRLITLLHTIRDGLHRSLDSLRQAATGSELPNVQVDDADVKAAALYLRDVGLKYDGLRLDGEFARLRNRCMDEWFASMADGESQEYRDKLTELFGPFPTQGNPNDSVVADRRGMVVGWVAQLSELVSELISSVTALSETKPDATDDNGQPPTTTPSGAQGGVVGETTSLDKWTRDIAKATAVVVGKKNTAGVSRLLEIAHSDETVDRRLYLMNQTRLLRADVSARELAWILECSPTAVKRTRWWKARMTQRKQEKANAEAAYHSRRGARGGKHRR